MNHYVALFRGINVGGNNVLPMKDLRAYMEALHYLNVATYIQSGNVVFSSPKALTKNAATHIGNTIAEHKGFTPAVLLLSAADFQQAMAKNPFPTEEGKALHCYFLAEIPTQPNIEKLTNLQASDEQFQLIDRVFYLYAPSGIGRSKLAAGAEKALGVAVTARNWNTMEKLNSLLADR